MITNIATAAVTTTTVTVCPLPAGVWHF